MKPGLAVLPLEVWADIFLSPWFTRQELAQILNGTANRNFANKLDKLVHDCGKHSLRFLKISYKPKVIIDKTKTDQSKEQMRNPKISECRSSLAVAPHGRRSIGHKMVKQIFEDCEFPVTEMPENIKTFKKLTIGFFDDQALDFLNKIKPLFTDVLLKNWISLDSPKSAESLRMLYTHLLPMLGGIRGISCGNECVQLLERHFPGTLARAKELRSNAKSDSIPTYLNWLSAPQDFDLDGPRFLKLWTFVDSNTSTALVEAVRKHFLVATVPSTFVIFIELTWKWRQQQEPEHFADEFNIENATTKEQLSVRNSIFKTPDGEDIHYVEILRHPIGADANMREWIKGRTFCEKTPKYDAEGARLFDEAAEQVISTGPFLFIGNIAKKAAAADQFGNDAVDGEDEAAGPSAAKKMKK